MVEADRDLYLLTKEFVLMLINAQVAFNDMKDALRVVISKTENGDEICIQVRIAS